jgi:hypothetical protein
MKTEDITKIFTYHAPHGTQQSRYVEIREKAKELALIINALTPDSREKSLAITHLQIAIMMANASIAINEVASL